MTVNHSLRTLSVMSYRAFKCHQMKAAKTDAFVKEIQQAADHTNVGMWARTRGTVKQL